MELIPLWLLFAQSALVAQPDWEGKPSLRKPPPSTASMQRQS